MPVPKEPVRLLVADPQGRIYDHPTLRSAGERVERDVFEFIERMEALGVLTLEGSDK